MGIAKRTWRAQNSPRMKAIQRAQEQIQQGKLWRAKDILGGSLSNYPFTPEIYRAYGDLLLQMGDLREAGRFLFLSGTREPNYSDAIAIFLSQFENANKNNLYSAFPSRARLGKLSDYPAAVADELKKRGFQEIIRHSAAPPIPKRFRDKVKGGCLAIFGIIIFILLGIGLIELIGLGGRTLFQWIGGNH
jgi:hypothetical protein